MSIPSNESLARLAMKLAHEHHKNGCVDCGAVCEPEMHEILGRAMRPILGTTVCILGVTLAPLCGECHRAWEKMHILTQHDRLYRIYIEHPEYIAAQRNQIYALRAQGLKA